MNKNSLKIIGFLAVIVSISAFADPITRNAASRMITFNIVNNTHQMVQPVAVSAFFGECKIDSNIVCYTDHSGKLQGSVNIAIDRNNAIPAVLYINAIPGSSESFAVSSATLDYTYHLSTTRWDGKSNLVVILTINPVVTKKDQSYENDREAGKK